MDMYNKKSRNRKWNRLRDY